MQLLYSFGIKQPAEGAYRHVHFSNTISDALNVSLDTGVYQVTILCSRRIRDKYESEIVELERSEKLTMDKYNQTKAQLIEAEGENERSKVTHRQKDREINELKKVGSPA